MPSRTDGLLGHWLGPRPTRLQECDVSAVYPDSPLDWMPKAVDD